MLGEFRLVGKYQIVYGAKHAVCKLVQDNGFQRILNGVIDAVVPVAVYPDDRLAGTSIYRNAPVTLCIPIAVSVVNLPILKAKDANPLLRDCLNVFRVHCTQ